MVRSWLHRTLFDNLALKLVSLALALLIFVSVRGEKQSLVYGTVRVSFTAPPGRALLGEPPDELQVSVLGPTSRIPRFRFEDIADVNVDLASVPAGYLKFRSDMIHLPPEFSVASIRPAGFRVIYADLVARSVPIHVTLEGQIAAGFRVGRVVAVPATVSVRGAEDVLRGLADLRTRPVVVEGARASLVARVALLPLPPGVVGKRPKQVEVSIEIVPLAPKIVLAGIPVLASGLEARGLELVPARVDVTVTGPPELLANFDKAGVVARVAMPPPPGAVAPGARLTPRIERLPDGVVVRQVVPATVLVQRRTGVAPRRGRVPTPARRPRGEAVRPAPDAAAE